MNSTQNKFNNGWMMNNEPIQESQMLTFSIILLVVIHFVISLVLLMDNSNAINWWFALNIFINQFSFDDRECVNCDNTRHLLFQYRFQIWIEFTTSMKGAENYSIKQLHFGIIFKLLHAVTNMSTINGLMKFINHIIHINEDGIK